MNEKKLDLGRCFFCDKLVMVDSINCLKEDYENIRKILGNIPDRIGGKIGNKIICKSCRDDILSMIQE